MKNFTFSFKSLLVACGLLIGSANAWAAGETKGDYKYTLDFETCTGITATGTSTDGTETLTATIQGGGQFIDYGDGFGTVFRNCGGDPRRYFLQLPSTLFTHSNTSKELSIGFWVTARGMNPSDYTYAPLFAAYENNPDFTATDKEYWGTNTSPMLLVPSFGTFQVNCEGYCDFDGDLNTAPNAGKNTLYNTNHWFLTNTEKLATNTAGVNWLGDNKWHYFTLTMTESTVTIYMDGEVKNQWSVDGTEGKSVSGVFSDGDKLKVICLGGNQAWELNDNDKGFSFDDFMFTNKALDASAIATIMDEKLVSSATALYYDNTYTKGKEALNTAKTTLDGTSSTENRTALLAAINTFCQNNANYTHPYAVSITNGDFGMGPDYWNATNLQTWSGNWGRGGWNRWIEMAAGNSGSDASIYQVTETLPAGHYVMRLNALTWNAGYTISLGNGTTSESYRIPNNSGTYTSYSVSYDLAEDGTLKLELKYDAENGAENSWSAFDDVELIYYGDATFSTTLDNLGYATFASPYALDLGNITGATAYKAAIDGSVVRFTELSQTVNPNEGILLKGDADAVVTIPVVSSGTDVVGNDFLVNTSGAVFDAAANTTYFAMYKNQSSLTFAKFDPSTLEFPANKAYLKVTSVGGVKALQIVFNNDEATGIAVPEAVEAEEGALYNTAGQQVTADFKGVVIKNGKKFLNK